MLPGHSVPSLGASVLVAAASLAERGTQLPHVVLHPALQAGQMGPQGGCSFGTQWRPLSVWTGVHHDLLQPAAKGGIGFGV